MKLLNLCTSVNDDSLIITAYLIKTFLFIFPQDKIRALHVEINKFVITAVGSLLLE